MQITPYGSPTGFSLMMSHNNNLGPVGSGIFIKNVLHPYSHQLKVAHLNCQSIRPSAGFSKIDELKCILYESKLDLFGISETWLKPHIANLSVNIPGYKFIRNDRTCCRGGGVGLYVSNRIKYKVVFRVMETGVCESLFVEIVFGMLKVLCGVVYLPHGDIETFENMHHQFFLNYSKVIIVGDFNYNLFEPAKSCNIRSLCTRNNLCISHNNKPSHFDVAHGSTSLIDFWLLSDISMMSSSDQIQCPTFSHHALIFASFLIDIDCAVDYVEFLDFNSIDWNSIFSFLDAFDFSTFSSCGVDEQCSTLNYILEQLLLFVPKKRKKIKYEIDVWMKSKNVIFARVLRDLAFSAFSSYPSTDNKRTFCKYRNRLKRTIRREKRRYFSSLFHGLDSSGMWRVLKNNGCVADRGIDFKYNVDSLNDFFVCGGNNNNTHESFDFNDFDDLGFSFRCVNELEVFQALSMVKSNAIGVDNISIKFIKLVYPYLSKYFLLFINNILTTSVFPMAWKRARVVAIPKSKVVHGLEDLRPISILPAISKIVEHILKLQLFDSIIPSLHESQYAYRPGHNTTSLILSLTDCIRESLNANELSVVISLDISKAFNSIDHHKMILKLKNEFNFSLSACKLIWSYLNGRSQFVSLNGLNSNIRPLGAGVPQGSVLGPLLFIMYMNSLSDFVSSHICKAFIYADDVFLFFKCGYDFCDVLEANINFSLDRVLRWTRLNSLSLNISKTKAIGFSRSSRFIFDLEIKLNGVKIDFVESLLILGIIIDSSLSFNAHLNSLHGKVFGILRKLFSTNLFLPLSIRNRVAHSLLMPLILYGFEVVSGTNASFVATLKRIVHMTVRYVYNVNFRDHISRYVFQFLGCSFQNFIEFRNLILFYKVLKSGNPITLYRRFIFSRSIRNPQLIIPRIACHVFENSFVIRVARSFNHLPINLRNFSLSVFTYRKKLLEHLSNL